MQQSHRNAGKRRKIFRENALLPPDKCNRSFTAFSQKSGFRK